jgi:hypothetical protein
MLIQISLCLTIGLAALLTGLAQAQKPNWLDFRYDFNSKGDLYHYVEFTHTKGNLVFPDIVYLKLPQFDYHELEVGLDYTFYTSKEAMHQICLLPTWASGDVRHFLYCVSSYWWTGKWDANAFYGYVGKLNNASSEFWLVDPAVLRYRISDKLRLGINFTGSKARHSAWERALGPSLTIDDSHGLWELRAAFPSGKPEDSVEWRLERTLVW